MPTSRREADNRMIRSPVISRWLLTHQLNEARQSAGNSSNNQNRTKHGLHGGESAHKQSHKRAASVNTHAKEWPLCNRFGKHKHPIERCCYGHCIKYCQHGPQIRSRKTSVEQTPVGLIRGRMTQRTGPFVTRYAGDWDKSPMYSAPVWIWM